MRPHVTNVRPHAAAAPEPTAAEPHAPSGRHAAEPATPCGPCSGPGVPQPRDSKLPREPGVPQPAPGDATCRFAAGFGRSSMHSASPECRWGAVKGSRSSAVTRSWAANPGVESAAGRGAERVPVVGRGGLGPPRFPRPFRVLRPVASQTANVTNVRPHGRGHRRSVAGELQTPSGRCAGELQTPWGTSHPVVEVRSSPTERPRGTAPPPTWRRRRRAARRRRESRTPEWSPLE